MWPRSLVIILLLATNSGLADDIALVRVGDTWRFAPALGPVVVQDGDWMQPGVDDRLWLLGRSGFSGGSANEATHLPVLQASYSSAFFRRQFNVLEHASVQWLTLRIDYSDGFVAFLNGREISRRNAPGEPGTSVPYDQFATNYHARGDPEEIDVSQFAKALVSGTNVLAIQLLSAVPGSTGLYLSAELMANFDRAPYLQNASSNRVQIIWKTPVPADTRVEFEASVPGASQFVDTNLVTTHVATLADLMSDTIYRYRVSSSDARVTARASERTFRTFKVSGPVRFIVLGDAGLNSVAQYQIAQVMQRCDSDFVIEVGDTVYPSFTRDLADLRCFSPYEPHLRTTPYFFAIGNHDLYSGVTNYLEAFYLPTNSVPLSVHKEAQTSPEHYYSFDQGDAHFVVLYVPFRSQYPLVQGNPQYDWLTNDLAKTQQPWKLVFFHVPMNSSSAHRFDDTDLDGEYDRLEIRNVLLPVLSRYGVQMAFSGHEHGYERFNPTNGVHSITTAGGGQSLYGFTQLDFASAFFAARHNCVRVTIENDRLEAQALDTDGNVFDSMTIQRRPPPPQVYEATWSSPQIEPGPPDDLDGNVFGQRFGLAGEPIPAMAGQFSNLGRLFVNNDQANLYVGLDQVMIYGDNNLFLFIDSPRRAELIGLAAWEME